MVGYAIGNEMDKQEQPRTLHVPPPQPVYPAYSEPAGNVRTDCTKVIIRQTVDGKTVETIEERCEGRKTEATY